MQSEIVLFVLLALTLVLTSQGAENEKHIDKLKIHRPSNKENESGEVKESDDKTNRDESSNHHGSRGKSNLSKKAKAISTSTSIFTQSGTGVVMGLRTLCAVLCIFVAY